MMIPDYSKLPENASLSLEKKSEFGEWECVDWIHPAPCSTPAKVFAAIQCGSAGWFVFPPESDKPVAGPYPVSDAAFNAAIAWYRGLPIPPPKAVVFAAVPKKSFFE